MRFEARMVLFKVTLDAKALDVLLRTAQINTEAGYQKSLLQQLRMF